MHLNYPAGNFHSKGAQEFADKVKEATNGELTIVLHPGAALGFKGPELLRAVAEGQLVIAEVPTGMVEGDAPVLALTAQPFISTNAFEQRLLYQLAKPTYAKVLKKFQIVETAKILAETGRQYLNRTEKGMVKDRVLSVLLRRYPATPKVYDLVWNYEDGSLWFFSHQSRHKIYYATLAPAVREGWLRAG